MSAETEFAEMRVGGGIQMVEGGPYLRIGEIIQNGHGNWFVQIVGADPALGPFFMGRKPRRYVPPGSDLIIEAQEVAA